MAQMLWRGVSEKDERWTVVAWSLVIVLDWLCHFV